jgi:hypothetical protein
MTQGRLTMAVLYEDDRIVCDDDAITIHMYYFPLGSRRIPYGMIRGFEEIEMGPLTGQYRIWGATDPRFWFHLDASRPRKRRAIVIDKGEWVKAVITPEDPDAVASILRDKVR